jgi:hypothetical protein
VRRALLVTLFALLTFSASGISAAVFAESCEMTDSGSSQHNDCAPTCVTCGCCVHAVEPATFVVFTTGEAPLADPIVPEYRLIKSEPRDVLHVPKR